jgi:hypothetical protein
VDLDGGEDVQNKDDFEVKSGSDFVNDIRGIDRELANSYRGILEDLSVDANDLKPIIEQLKSSDMEKAASYLLAIHADYQSKASQYLLGNLPM